jgi:uncharacterized protein (DUF427 family)
MTNNPINNGPGYRQHPDHRIVLEASLKRFCVYYRGQLIADSERVLVMHEPNYKLAHYFPRKDVQRELMLRHSRTAIAHLKVKQVIGQW